MPFYRPNRRKRQFLLFASFWRWSEKVIFFVIKDKASPRIWWLVAKEQSEHHDSKSIFFYKYT